MMNNKDNVRQLETGELELRKAFEEATIQNVKMIVDFSQETRKLTRELGEKVDHLSNLILTKDKELETMNIQLAALQQRLYSQGT